MAADALEVRIAHLEGAYEQIDKRLGAIEGDVRELRSSIASLRSELLARMDHQFF
jgi:chromosome segregation ATPase